MRSLLLSLIVGAAVVAHEPPAQQSGAPPQAARPPAPASTAVASFVMGRVIDGVTRAPIPDAVVELSASGPSEPPPRALTDTQGQFLFRAVRAAEYRLIASAPGYANGGYGQSRPDAPVARLVVAGDRPIASIEIRLWKLGAIRGHIRDEAGEPLAGVAVRAYALAERGGIENRVLVAVTDDRGDYALVNLPSGHYVVAVPFVTVASPVPVAAADAAPPRPGSTPPPTVQVRDVLVRIPYVGSSEPTALVGTSGARPLVRPTVFYPASPNPTEASVIVVTPGSTRTAVDVTIRTVPSVFVSGTVVGGTLPATLRLRRADADDPLVTDANPFSGEQRDVSRTTSVADGRFTFVGVPPGNYIVVVDQIRTGPATATVLPAWARVPVVVGSDDVTGVTVPMTAGLRVRGRIVLDGQETEPAGLGRWGAFLNSPGRNTVNATMAEGATFTAEGLMPGPYTLFVNAPAGYVMGWIEVGGRRMTARAIDIVKDTDDVTLVVTKRLGRVEGELAAGSAPAGSVRVLFFTADRAAWPDALRDSLRVRSTMLSEAGGFTLTSVPPGDYFIVAVPDEAFDPRWRDMTSLGRLATSALRLTVASAETKKVSVPVAGRSR